MAAMPYMPLYIADYLSDAAHLTTLEHGAYLLLIMTYWQRGEALPDDDKKLARIAGLDARNWARVKPQICEFFTSGDNRLMHPRVERELASVRAKSLKKREGGLARAKQMHSNRLAPAKLTDTDTDTDILPFPIGKGARPDSDKAFWDAAKAYLIDHGKKNPGALIGKWCSQYGQDDTAKAITEAQIARAADPVPYIEAILRKGGREADNRVC